MRHIIESAIMKPLQELRAEGEGGWSEASQMIS